MRAASIVACACLIAGSGPACATAGTERSPAALYMRARAADVSGEAQAAAAGYAAALTASPNDEMLATRTMRQAILAGDRPLAVRAARTLEARQRLPVDGSLLLLVDAVAAGDWKRASLAADRVRDDELFSFLDPVLRAWIALGARDGDPLSRLEVRRPSALAAAYTAEHRALLLLATGKAREGATVLKTLTGQGGGRVLRLQLAAAAALMKEGQRDQALLLLAGDEPPAVAMRRRIEAGRPLSATIATPADGIAELLVRVAVDINRERVTPLALTLARLATFLAPRNSETWLVTAELLTASQQYDGALSALTQVAPDDPFAVTARDARMLVLVRKGAKEQALADALKATTGSDVGISDWTRVGELYITLHRYGEAAEAYRRALALAEANAEGKEARWTLWLQRGGALERAGNWPEAKAALSKAAALAPEEPVALNYLGYAQLERRENLAEAERLIERASKLRPEDGAITDSLGWAYFIRGDVPKAIVTLERAVETEPGEPTINEHLGDAYWTAGRRREARFAWQAALVYADEEDAPRIRTKLDTGLTPEVAAP